MSRAGCLSSLNSQRIVQYHTKCNKLKCKSETIKQFPGSACNFKLHVDELQHLCPFQLPSGSLGNMRLHVAQEHKSCSPSCKISSHLCPEKHIISAPKEPAEMLRRLLQREHKLCVWSHTSRGARVTWRTLSPLVTHCMQGSAQGAHSMQGLLLGSYRTSTASQIGLLFTSSFSNPSYILFSFFCCVSITGKHVEFCTPVQHFQNNDITHSCSFAFLGDTDVLKLQSRRSLSDCKGIRLIIVLPWRKEK